DVQAVKVKKALCETGLQMLGLNTRRGNVEKGDNGLSAIPGREIEARAAIDEAINYAVQIGAPKIHVMAGFSSSAEAGQVFIDNLQYACENGAQHNLTMLIEPLNRYDAPGYFLQTTNQAAEIIKSVNTPNLKLMFDCYHVGRTEGNVIAQLRELFPIIGHIQFASVPDRGPPDHGEVDYQAVFSEIMKLGWSMPLGAEYKPMGETDTSLDWMT
ncbi:MAG: TIM barrel protein, partial [Salaquimonas sp.]